MAWNDQAAYPSTVEGYTPAFQSDVELASGLLNPSLPVPAIGGVDAEQQALLAFLRRRHPLYEKMLRHWIFVEETYNGGREWFAPHNIFRYIKEGDKEFHDRLKRCYRFNHTREVCDLVQKYIFKSPVIRNTDDAPAEVQSFWKKATLSNLDVNEFMKTVSNACSIFGRPWVFTDSNKSSTILSVADQKTAGSGVYSYIVTPRDILDVGFTQMGDVNWVLVRETVRDDEDPIHSSGVISDRYRLWTRNEWKLYRIVPDNSNRTDGTVVSAKSNQKTPKVIVELLGEGVHGLGVVPGFPVDHVVGDYRWTSPSLIGDIAYLDRAVANYLSNLDAIIQDQSFSQLAMPAQAVLPGQDAWDALVEMGTKRVFVYDGEGGAKPEYLSPDPRQAGLIMKVVNQIITEIYHTIGMAGERTKSDNVVGVDTSSGVAKAYDFERMNSLLTSKADSLEVCENKLIALVLKWYGKPAPKEDLVKYPDTFDVRSLFDEFTIAERLSLIEAPGGVRREQMGQVIDKLFPRIAADLKKALDAELESWPPPPDPGMQVTATEGGSGQTDLFDASGQKVMTAVKPAGGGAKKPAPKNPQTQKRQGQA